jgi:hypothetical protein
MKRKIPKTTTTRIKKRRRKNNLRHPTRPTTAALLIHT